MTNGSIRLLELPGAAWGELLGRGDHRVPSAFTTQRRFRYVVGSTGFTRAWRVALVLVDGAIVGAALLRRYGEAGHNQDGLEFLSARRFDNELDWSSVVAEVPRRLHRNFASPVDGYPLPHKTGIAVQEVLNRLLPGIGQVLADLRALIPGATPSGARTTLLEQRDAVALSLEVTGIDSRQALGQQIPEYDNDLSFLRNLEHLGVSEAATIRHDATAFDDWLLQEADNFDVKTFEDPDDYRRKVTVFYADKEALERQTGTDLIYYRHHRPGFILVQYKRMRPGNSSSPPTYYPDKQLQVELDRFREIPSAGDPTTVADWRLTEEAFFVKLVRHDLSKPPENRLVRGMYMPLNLVDLLLRDAEAGLREKGWSAKSITTYLSNEEFILLAKQGYIGTRGAATEHVKQVIQGSLERGRGVVVAVDQSDSQQVLRLRHG